MKYKLEIDDVFEYLAHDYLTVDKVDYNGRRFFLANKLIDEETPGKEFVIFEALPEGLVVPNEDGADIGLEGVGILGHLADVYPQQCAYAVHAAQKARDKPQNIGKPVRHGLCPALCAQKHFKA